MKGEKNMKSKGRRDLINEIKELRREIHSVRASKMIAEQEARERIHSAMGRCAEMRRRLQVIGYNPEIEYIKGADRGTLVSTVTVDAMRFELSASGMDGDAIARDVCGKLANALYENGLVRIVFENEPHNGYSVKVGRARVDVIPWDKICRNRGRIIMEDPDVPFAERRITMSVERGADE